MTFNFKEKEAIGPDAEKALGHKHILAQVNKKNVSGLLERNNKASL